MTIENKREVKSPNDNDAFFEQQASKEEIYLEETEEEVRAKLWSVAPDVPQSTE